MVNVCGVYGVYVLRCVGWGYSFKNVNVIILDFNMVESFVKDYGSNFGYVI